VGDLSDALNDPNQARMARNGDTSAVVQQIHAAVQTGVMEPNPAARRLSLNFSHDSICPRLIQLLENTPA
jgi:hypothetical protein